MFGVSMDPGSVPDHAFLVEHDGLLCVDWEREPGRPPSKGDLLSEFAGLSALAAEDTGPAVVRLVKRFGVLSLCEPHFQPLDTVEHAECPRLKPEPVTLWLWQAHRVHQILHMLRALESGEDPEPYDIRHQAPPRDKRGRIFAERWSLKLERRRRAIEWPSDSAEESQKFDEQFPAFAAEFYDEVSTLASTIQSKEDELNESVASIQRLLPGADDADEWRGRIRALVNRGLDWFPPTLRLGQDEDTDALRLVLSTSMGVLSRVYLSLAMEAAKAPGVAFCTGCAGPYAPKRRPKRGQDNFCPRCREARVPQRLHMRRKRAADISSDPTT